MGRTKSTLLGILSSQFFTIVSTLLSLVTTPLIVKGLNPQIYGLSIIIFQLIGYLGQFDFGLSAGASRFLAATRAEDAEHEITVNKIISTSFGVYLIIGVAIALTGLILAPLALRIFNVPPQYQSQVKPIVMIVCVLVGAQMLLRSISGIFFAHQMQVLSNSLSFILLVSNTLLTVLFVYRGCELWSFVYAQMASFMINTLINLFYFGRYYSHIKLKPGNFDKGLLRQMFSYGFFIFLNGIAVQIVFQTDRVVIGSLVSLTAVSVYSLTTRMPELLSAIVWKISDNAFPGIVEIADDEEKFRNIHNKIMKLSMTVSTAGFWLILLITLPFLRLWVGQQYYAGAFFLVCASFLYLIHHTYMHVTAVCLNAAGIVKGFSLMSLIESALNIVISLWLCNRYGIIGVIYGTLISGTITSCWYVPFVAIKGKHFTLSSYLRPILQPMLFCSVFGLLAYVAFHNSFERIDNWFKLIFYTGFVSLIFLIPSFLINRSVILNIKQRLYAK